MTEITLEQANKIIEAAHQEGQQRKLSPLTVVVLDSGGHLKALSRADGASLMRPQIAMAKAWGQLASVYHLANWQRWAKQGLCS